MKWMPVWVYILTSYMFNRLTLYRRIEAIINVFAVTEKKLFLKKKKKYKQYVHNIQFE